jgi:hypothetical protein
LSRAYQELAPLISKPIICLKLKVFVLLSINPVKMVRMWPRLEFALIIAVSLSSCNVKQSIKDNTYRTGVITSHEFLSYSFKVDSATLTPEYYRYLDFFSEGGSDFLLAYNYKTHSLDLFNLTERVMEGHISLSNDGPNAIIEVLGLDVINRDSIFFADISKFSIVNGSGSIIWSLKRNDPKILGDIPAGFLVTWQGDFDPFYCSESESFIVSYVPFESKLAFELPMLMQVSVTNDQGSLIPMYNPDFPKAKYNPFYLGARSCYTNDKIVINYAFSSDIHVYDRKSHQVNKFGGRSSLTENYLTVMEDGENPDDYYLKSLCFFNLTYDPYRDLFYRTHWGEMPLRKSEFVFNTFYDKPIYLSVFDDEFNFLYETKLDIESGIVPEMLIPTKDGLLVFPYKQEVEDMVADSVRGYLIRFSN